MSDKTEIALKERTVKVLMFTVTEALAGSLFNWSNVLLTVGAAAVLIGTIGAFAMGAAKEQFSNERIVANEAETARAVARAAEANANAKESELKLASLKRQVDPRRLTPEQVAILTEGFNEIARTMPEVRIGPTSGDPETASFFAKIVRVLAKSNLRPIIIPVPERARFPSTGIGIWDENRMTSPLKGVFERAGIEVGIIKDASVNIPQDNGGIPKGPDVILIGAKPVPKE